MKYLFLVAFVLIGYGSLYPFEFHAQSASFRVLFEPSTSSRGDFLENVALFLPYGYLGMVAWRRPGRPLRFGIVLVTAAIYSALLQWAQLYLPSRDPTLRDAGTNMIGAAIGAVVGSIPFLDMRRLGERADLRPAPWIVIGFWIGYRLLPFVPTVDWQEWKDSLKPLREWHPFPWVRTLHDAAAWAAVGCLWAAAPIGRLTVRWLPALALAVLALEVVVVDNVLSPATVAGAAIGIALAALIAWRPAPAAILLVAALVLSGLAPFEARAAPAAIKRVPFQGFLEGSMLTNAQSLFEKAFLYCALVWLGREAGLRLGVATAAVAILLAGIEAGQTVFAGHTPEVTDPLLAIFAALFLRVADHRPRPPPVPVQSPDR